LSASEATEGIVHHAASSEDPAERVPESHSVDHCAASPADLKSPLSDCSSSAGQYLKNLEILF